MLRQLTRPLLRNTRMTCVRGGAGENCTCANVELYGHTLSALDRHANIDQSTAVSSRRG